jgi:hypothetical protein
LRFVVILLLINFRLLRETALIGNIIAQAQHSVATTQYYCVSEVKNLPPPRFMEQKFTGQFFGRSTPSHIRLTRTPNHKSNHLDLYDPNPLWQHCPSAPLESSTDP